MQKLLATAQTGTGNGNGADMISGYVPIGGGLRNGYLTLVAADAPDMTVVVEMPDANGEAILLHTEVISAAISKPIYLGDFPFAQIRTRCSAYVNGNYSAALQSS